MSSIPLAHTHPKFFMTCFQVNQYRSCACAFRSRLPLGTIFRCPESVVNNHVTPGSKLLLELYGGLFENWTFKGRKDTPREVDSVNAMSAEHLFVWAKPEEPTGCERTRQGRLT